MVGNFVSGDEYTEPYNVISEPICDDIPPRMKSLYMVIPFNIFPS